MFEFLRRRFGQAWWRVFPVLVLYKNRKKLSNPEGDYRDYFLHQLSKTLTKTDKDASFRYEPVIKVLGGVLKGNDSKQKVLCVGCRNGYELDAFEKDGFKKVVGIDLFSKDPRIQVMNMENMSFPDNSFQVVYSGDSLEHSFDINQSTREFCRVVRDGGIIAVQIPVNLPQTDAVDRWDLQDKRKVLDIFKQHVKQVEEIWSDEREKGLGLIFRVRKS